MPNATEPLHNRIALVFDFDATLAPDSLDALLRRAGYDPKRFRDERVRPLKEAGWDEILAHCYRLVEASRSGEGERITRELIAEVGRDLEPYEGVPELFDRVRQWARAIVPDVEVEFYVLTSGYVDIHRHTSIAKEFDAMWGTEFHFNEDGEIDWARQIITFTEKDLYLLQLSKGLGTQGPNSPQFVYRRVSETELHVPFNQMIYVGDGGSDMPVFRLLGEGAGFAFGVFKEGTARDWQHAGETGAGRNVDNLAKADYRDGSELMRSIQLAVESISKLIALRKLSVGE